MPHATKTVVLLKSTTAAATADAPGYVTIVEQFTSAIAKLQVTAASGTSPTLNVLIQRGFRDINTSADTTIGGSTSGSIIWDDYAAFTQATGAATYYLSVTGSGEEAYTASDGALTAGSIRNGPLGSLWRVTYVIGGTNPSFTFSVIAQLIP